MKTPNNKVRELRLAAKLTQKQLAELCGTSQQQIQRIESGQIATRIELATAIAVALNMPMSKVFPEATKALARLADKASSEAPSGRAIDEALLEVEQGGVDADPRRWTLKMLLRGHTEFLFLPIDAESHRLLWLALNGEIADPEQPCFVEFNSTELRLLLNIQQVVLAQFLFDVNLLDSPTVTGPLAVDPESGNQFRVLFAGSPRLFGFGVEIDVPEEHGSGPLEDFMTVLMSEPKAHEHVSFTDVDGEEVFLRTGDIALLAIDADVFEGFPDDEDDDQLADDCGEDALDDGLCDELEPWPTQGSSRPH